jgi:hypothetical protein
MTEEEWFSVIDPQHLVEFVRGRVSDRKLRLFACACCRSIWHRLPDPRSRQAIETTERFIEAEATGEELTAAREAAEVAQLDALQTRRRDAGEEAVVATASILEWKPTHWPCLGSVIYFSARSAGEFAELSASNKKGRQQNYLRGCAEEYVNQCALFRDLIGNPFSPFSTTSSLLDWNGAVVPRLAEAIYQDRAFDRLPILADALEEAGCTDAAMLDHCRQPGKHVRGCWIVDLLLGKS